MRGLSECEDYSRVIKSTPVLKGGGFVASALLTAHGLMRNFRTINICKLKDCSHPEAQIFHTASEIYKSRTPSDFSSIGMNRVASSLNG